jgi:sarcosine oxidase
MARVHDVAIVGAGLLGLAAARALAARDRDFVLLEQASVGHAGAGSKGSCRIFRLGYPDARYVTAARQAGELWRELEAQTGHTILLPTPQLTFGPQLTAVQDALRAAGADCVPISQQEAAERFPGIRLPGPALLETQSSVTAADQALAALATAAGLSDGTGQQGERLHTGVRVTSITDDSRQVSLHTTDGTVTARVAIVTAGPWTAGLLAGLALPTAPTLEQVAYLAPAGPPRSTPIFICYDEQSPYGLPVPGSDLYKIGIHPSGPPADPNAQSADPDPVLIARLREVTDRYLPGWVPEPVSTERCIYDNSQDEDFIIDRVGNVVLGCGTSGHGFKFGPLLGEWLAALAISTDAAAHPAPRFRLTGRFA